MKDRKCVCMCRNRINCAWFCSLHGAVDGALAGVGGVEEALDVHLPLREVGAEDAAVVGD